MRLTALFLFFSCLAGCASGSSVVIGETSRAIQNWQSVTITTEMPEGARTIALVKASSAMGATKQGSVDYAIEELKKQAAKVGANTVVIGSTSTKSNLTGFPAYGAGMSGGYIYNIDEEVIEGMAVYVDQQQSVRREHAQTTARKEQQEKLDNPPGPDKYERLIKLGQLRDDKILTEEEFQELKKRILAEN